MQDDRRYMGHFSICFEKDGCKFLQNRRYSKYVLFVPVSYLGFKCSSPSLGTKLCAIGRHYPCNNFITRITEFKCSSGSYISRLALLFRVGQKGYNWNNAKHTGIMASLNSLS